MKKLVSCLAVIFLMSLATVVFAAAPESQKPALKVGDTVYVCGCGSSCPCKSMSMKPAKCTCNKEMVPSKVLRIEGDNAIFKVKGEEETFPMTGKYVCGCGAGCDCNYVSQSPGKCACGKELVPAK
ncbi:hypothetical protein [Fundidesulfovibrio soli]|uniref:hypothetical protein n=1 Tax=Fundidesulfovibrio soli TaxID=2922716 RepID=UPI001FAF9FE4|nr:hypothetical protein [Fundidesulfovibrio soli]